MLFNEPKLLKLAQPRATDQDRKRFSALQRAEIAEIPASKDDALNLLGFSALQRAEIAEIVSPIAGRAHVYVRFSALQRAEIAEIVVDPLRFAQHPQFQCSSTSRNC